IRGWFFLVGGIGCVRNFFTSFTLVPLLTSRFGRLEHISGKNVFEKFVLWFEKQLTNFTNWVGSILGWALNHKFITLSIVVVLFFSSFQLVSKKFISSEFMPQGDRGEFLVQIELPKDVSIEQTNQMTRIAEDYLASLPEVTSTIATVG